jgi:hypothetical protein
MQLRTILWIGLFAFYAPFAEARGGGSAMTAPNFVNPFAGLSPATTSGNVGQSTGGSARTNPFASGTSLNAGLVPRSTSPFVPLVQTRPTVTTSVLSNTGNGTFTVTAMPRTGGVFTFSNGTLTSVNGNVLAPNIVTPQHEMTQSKIIMFQ